MQYLHTRMMAFDHETLYELHYQMITLGKVSMHDCETSQCLIGSTGTGRNWDNAIVIGSTLCDQPVPPTQTLHCHLLYQI